MLNYVEINISNRAKMKTSSVSTDREVVFLQIYLILFTFNFYYKWGRKVSQIRYTYKYKSAIIAVRQKRNKRTISNK